MGVLQWNQLELLYSLHREIGVEPPGAPLSVIVLLFILGKNLLNQNDVEYDLSIVYALVLFLFFFNNKQKMYGGPCTSPSYPPEIHIYRYILDIKHYFYQISW